MRISPLFRFWLLVAAFGYPSSSALAQQRPIDFDKQIRPILSDACFACHGPDAKQRKANLRLDLKVEAFAPRDGYTLIAPGSPDESELLYRVESEDALEVMPPPESGKSLKPEQIALLRQWIEQGANWEEHWAFSTPIKAEPPATNREGWAVNPIDQFILARLEAEGLEPNGEADRETLIRRVTFDLTGLPPTPEEVTTFVEDDAPDAYERLVDRLLRSPRYGEHMARYWLDVSRYGDTHGLHLDNYREMWPYRDWVINAFNNNKPFDEFIIEQLAGDLLPDSNLDQKIATGFNRNNVTTSEGGSIEEEVYVRNTIDRVDTTGQVFLGLTVGCARCHDHKYDPISAKDYYSLFAFFNSIDGSPLDGNAEAHPPVVKVPSPEQTAKLAELDQKLASIRDQIRAEFEKVAYDPSADADQGEYIRRDDFVWVDDTLPPGVKLEVNGATDQPWPFVGGPEHPVLSGSTSHNRVADGQAQHYFTNANPGLKVGEGDAFFVSVFLDPLNPPKQIMLQWHTGEWKHRAYWGENLIDYGKDGTPERLAMGPLPTTGEWVRLEVPAAQLGIAPGTMITGMAFTQHGGNVHWDQAGLRTYTPQAGQTYSSLASWIRAQKVLADKAELPNELKEIVKKPRDQRQPEETARLVRHFVEKAYDRTRSIFDPLHQQLATTQTERDAFDKEVPTTLVFKEAAKPRAAFVLNRGEYDQKGDEVGRATPAFLPPLPESETPDRLALARWFVSPEHPLTSRVAVNRFWQQFFGTGLVKTADDFGSQGEPPSHPELLDWLAVRFQDDDWNVKTFMKRIVLSSTYRQSSKLTPEKRARDPENRLLARGPRFRLDAEMLRDQALFYGGLLVERLGGPSVKPPQPEGIWEAVAYTGSNTGIFKADEGIEKVHRRSLYTFWKRTAPPPQMSTFDAPSRESCTVRRERTNTPLQALLLMNETQYVEAARSMAYRVLKAEDLASQSDRLIHAFRMVTSRQPTAAELQILETELNDLLARYQASPEDASKLLQVGIDETKESIDRTELAAWTILCNTLLNLDEVVTKG